MAKLPEEFTFHDLERIEKTEERTDERPTALPLSEVLIAPKVFQQRSDYGQHNEREIQVGRLILELERNKGDPLDPIVVVPIGAKFYCVDGHHRREAYEHEAWSKPVPVTTIEDKLFEAMVKSWQLNAKPTRNTSENDRLDWAWKLVQMERMSKKQVVEASGTSEGLVAKMRRILSSHGNAVRGHPWRRVRSWDKPEVDRGNDDWLDQEAEKLAASMVKASHLKLSRSPEVLARAIFIINEKLPERLMDEWRELTEDSFDLEDAELDI